MEKYRRPAIPAELAEHIEAFIQGHPEMGEHSLSGFTTRACQRHLARLKRELYLSEVLEGNADPDELLPEKD